ncbi:MDR family MFS transporter [Streptococcus pseudoporcinus]|uniref:Transporter, major facilitator family protein n=1 Tax=Streptococcus pseudoporcinus LQ 940-04 TaxID=875093 RepID=G5K7I1_9STRE|nr:MFS transporter [Streptococcus pseudoporcinus]EFR44338.1 transporter, major facilitator family protein [Streptococcus pseudoporcinus SPIN 20026]EHI64571.1 transporter, major facilitator family protein [Streptococcus pseudoporcinus LQ 940-04]VEF93901.1 transporter protein [Streptococcus pseudoporcinus]
MKEFFNLSKQIQIRQLVRFVTITLGSSIFPFMAMYYATYFGTLWTGFLMIVTSFAGLLGSLYGGHLSDAIGRKKVVIYGSIGTTIGWLLAIVANVPNHVMPDLMFLGILLVELASSFYAPAYEAMLIDLTDLNNRKFVYTINYWFINIAVMLGAGLSGLFYDHYFLDLLIALFLVNILCFLIAYFYFDETMPEDHSFTHNRGLGGTFRNYKEVFKDKPFLIFTLGSILFSSIWLQMDNFVPVHLKLAFQETRVLGFQITGAKMLSIMVFTNTILIVALMTLSNKLTERWPLLQQLILGSGIFTVGMFLAFSFSHFTGIIIAVIIFTIGEMINVPANQVLRAEMMDQSKIGSYTGFISMTQPLGAVLAGLIVSLSHFTGLIGVQVSFLLIAIVGLYLIILAAKQKEKV